MLQVLFESLLNAEQAARLLALLSGVSWGGGGGGVVPLSFPPEFRPSVSFLGGLDAGESCVSRLQDRADLASFAVKLEEPARGPAGGETRQRARR